MLALKIVGTIILVVFLIAIIPIKVRVVYDGEAKVLLPVLFLKIKLYPRKKKLKEISQKKFLKLRRGDNDKNVKKKSAKKPKKKHKFTSDEENNEKKKLTVSGVTDLVREISSLVARILSKFSDYLKVKIYALKFVISTEDAAKTAITYGAVAGAVGNLMGILEDRCNIKYSRRSEAGIDCDFIRGNCEAKVDIRFSIRVWQIISLALKALINFIKIKSKSEVI